MEGLWLRICRMVWSINICFVAYKNHLVMDRLLQICLYLINRRFSLQLNAPMLPWTSRRIKHIVKEVMRIAFWFVFLEFVLYFFYFNAMKHDQGRMQTMPLATLGSIGWMHMQFFMLKYVVMFGIPRIFAQMDQFDPPEGPKCISRIHTLTVLWR